MKKSVFGRLALAATVLVVFLYSCANPMLGTTNLELASSKALTAADPVPAGALEAPLTAGAGNLANVVPGDLGNAGSVFVWKDSTNLYVKYVIKSGYDAQISSTHVWAGPSMSGFTTQNDFAPGQLGNTATYSPAVSSALVTISLADVTFAADGSLFLLTHASLTNSETAWAGTLSIIVSRWNFYIHGTIPTLEPPVTPEPPVVPETPTTTVPVVYQNISGFVFHDYNNNGVKDSGEPGLADVEVSLSTGAVTTTGSNGEYSFGGLLAQSYTVTSGGKTGFFPTEYDSPVTSRTVTASATEVNFGLSFETISGFTFRDYDADGVKDAGEPAVSGVTLTLSGAASASTPSAADGSYSFAGLKGGSAAYAVTAGNLTGEFHTPYLAPVTSWNGGASAANVNFGFSHESVTGVVFYDANHNDVYNAGEPLLQGFAVRLDNGSPVYTDANGAYTFDNLMGASTYTVSADDKTGFVHSVASSRTATPVNSQPAVANFGFAVDYSALLGKTANGFTIGYWKTNIDKAIAGTTKGVQVSASTLNGYVANLGSFQLFPLNVANLSAASAILSKTGSVPTDLLAKQLMGSELNYQNGAFIGGNALVTYFFLYDGEYMLANPGSFTSTQLLAQKDKYDAYNNTHGGALFF